MVHTGSHLDLWELRRFCKIALNLCTCKSESCTCDSSIRELVDATHNLAWTNLESIYGNIELIERQFDGLNPYQFEQRDFLRATVSWIVRNRYNAWRAAQWQEGEDDFEDTMRKYVEFSEDRFAESETANKSQFKHDHKVWRQERPGLREWGMGPMLMRRDEFFREFDRTEKKKFFDAEWLRLDRDVWPQRFAEEVDVDVDDIRRVSDWAASP